MGHIHKNDQFDYTISATIVHDKKVLLLFHHKLHFWVFPAGHIELDETPIQALYRETSEETGLSRNHLSLVTVFEDNADFIRDSSASTEPMPFDIDIHPVGDEGHRHIDFGYILISNTNEVQKEEGGAQKLEWFSLEEIETLSPMPQVVLSRSRYALEHVA